MRTLYCGHVNASHIDQEIYLCGWAHRRRDHGGVIFIDLRDREGLAQIVIDPDTPEAFKIAETVRSEFVLKVKCKVRKRPEGTVNKNNTIIRFTRLTRIWPSYADSDVFIILFSAFCIKNER